MNTSIPNCRGIIAAVGQDNVIGIDNRIPWSIPEDMKWFSQVTAGCSVVMGRKTFESLPEQYRPLPGRKNYVVSGLDPGFMTSSRVITHKDRLNNLATKIVGVTMVDGQIQPRNKEQHQKIVNSDITIVTSVDIKNPSTTVWYIGGERIYRQVIDTVDVMFITKVHVNIKQVVAEAKTVVTFPHIIVNDWNIFNLGPCGPNAERHLYIRRS